ncbi:hypothetical protein KCP78_15940 [Salmonella enterica subsp. enterica]|nr:hypothetical protein KCP78_15940 [Salmonella enterica subsp. enterica]
MAWVNRVARFKAVNHAGSKMLRYRGRPVSTTEISLPLSRNANQRHGGAGFKYPEALPAAAIEFECFR